MKRASLVFTLVLAMKPHLGLSQLPSGFAWVNLESDKATMAVVRRSLNDPSISAIREVGLEGGFALVMTVSREAGAPTPDFDRWTVYNVSLKTGNSRVLVSGYGVNLLDWIGKKQDELAITYYDCWECEAAKLFTTLRFKLGIGWRARWSNKSQSYAFPQPGVPVSTSDLSDDDDTQVELVFALISREEREFNVGSWIHTHNSKTGRNDDNVVRYSVDPVSKEDRLETLHGRSALEWEREICTKSDTLIKPSIGQDSNACLAILQNTASRKVEQK